MAEASSSGASLTVRGGPFDGTSVDFDASTDELLIGSDPGCRLALDLPGVSPIHARLWMDASGVMVSDTRSPRGLFVNDARVTEPALLRHGDILWLGPPGDSDSVMLQCRLEGSAEAGDDFFFGDAAPAAAASASSTTGGLDDLVPDMPPMDEVVFGDPVPEAAPSAPVQQDFFLEDVPASDVPVDTPVAYEEPVFEAPDEPDVPIAFAPVADLVPEAAPDFSAPEPDFSAQGNLGQPSGAPDFSTSGPDFSPPAAEGGGEDAFFVDEPEPEAVPAPPPAPAPPRAAVPPPAPPAAAAPASARAPILPTPAASPAIIDDTQFADPASAMSSTAPRSAPAARAAVPPAPARKAPVATSATRPSSARKSGPAVPMIAIIGVVVAAVLGAGVFFGLRMMRAPKIESAQPTRASIGQAVNLTGQHFSTEAAKNAVRFGSTPAKVVSASATSLSVEVPELPAQSGQDLSVPVVVAVDGRESAPVTLAVFRTPRIHGVSPNVAMPGEDIVLAGSGWGPGAKVKFGGAFAQVSDVTGTSMKVKVPALDVGTGKEVPVIVVLGNDASNAMSFVVGRLPLVTRVEPAAAASGDVVVVSGRGFDQNPSANKVTVGGVPALVASGSTTELQVVVPRGAAAGGLELRVPGLANVGQAALTVNPSPDPIDFRFIAEPFTDEAGHDHAILATGVGPAFVLSASGNKTAAQRALEAQQKLNQAGAAMRASLEAAIEARNLETAPALALVGRPEVLLEATGEDAEAYNEDWTGQRKGAPVTRARLAVWWEAVARDLVLLLIRGERPEHTAALASEGRVLGDIFQAARQTVAVGVPAAQMADAKPAQKEAVRTLALRVPASVPGAAGAETAGSASDSAPPLKLDGAWTGTETGSDGTRHITATFNKGTGSLTYLRALTLTVPLLSVEQGRGGVVRFRLQTGGGTRFYTGRWDGTKIAGTVSSDAAGKAVIGNFELASAH